MKKKHTLEGPWVPHRLVMLESLAWSLLSNPAHKVLDRLEIELMRNGPDKNGALVCTYDDFFSYGIRRSSIPGAIRQASALGFLEKTQQGRYIAGVKCPSQYRLTYVWTKNAAATDEWRTIKTDGQAQPSRQVVRRKKHNFSQVAKTGLIGTRKRDSSGPENGSTGPQNPRPENGSPI